MRACGAEITHQLSSSLGRMDRPLNHHLDQSWGGVATKRVLSHLETRRGPEATKHRSPSAHHSWGKQLSYSEGDLNSSSPFAVVTLPVSPQHSPFSCMLMTPLCRHLWPVTARFLWGAWLVCTASHRCWGVAVSRTLLSQWRKGIGGENDPFSSLLRWDNSDINPIQSSEDSLKGLNWAVCSVNLLDNVPYIDFLPFPHFSLLYPPICAFWNHLLNKLLRLRSCCSISFLREPSLRWVPSSYGWQHSAHWLQVRLGVRKPRGYRIISPYNPRNVK